MALQRRRKRSKKAPRSELILVAAVVIPALVGFIAAGTATALFAQPGDVPLFQDAATCGDGKCDASESASSCPADCGDNGGGADRTPEPKPGPVCGDGRCEGDENKSNCPADCGSNQPPDPVCGDGRCEGDENKNNCPADCGGSVGPVCGDGACEGGESKDNCPTDCGGNVPPGPVCGNGTCESGESADTCPADCGGNVAPVCGDGVCEEREKDTCPADCEVDLCGDGVCDDSEDAGTCPADCSAITPTCGDGVCSERERQDQSCPKDCGTPKPVCGDGVCEDREEDSCPADCRTATPDDPGGGGGNTSEPPDATDPPPAQDDPTPLPTAESTDEEAAPTIPSVAATPASFPSPTAPPVAEERQPNCRIVRLRDLDLTVQEAYRETGGEFDEATPAWLICERMPAEACIPVETRDEIAVSDLRLLNCTSDGTCTVHKVRRYEDGQACGRAGRLRLLTCLEGCTVVRGKLPASLTPESAFPMGVLIGLASGLGGLFLVAITRGNRDIDEEFGDIYSAEW